MSRISGDLWIFGGGRYDKLFDSMSGIPIPAIGFGFGDVVIGKRVTALPEKPCNGTELSTQTFCTFPREFSSNRRQRVGTRSDFVPEPGSANLLVPRAIPRSPGCAPDVHARVGSVGQSVNTPWSRGRVRVKGISRTTPIGWLQHVSGARRRSRI